MTRLRTLLVDDESLALDLMASILADMDNIEIVGRASNGRKALAAIRDLQPDLVFLDVQMPGMSGFDVIKELQSEAMPLVIFATAFDEYALDAFDVHAVDYLLKPTDPARVQLAVQRAAERLAANDPTDRKAPIMSAIEDLSAPRHEGATLDASATQERKVSKLAIRDRGVVEMVDFDSIDWVDAAGDYMCVHADGQTHVLRTTMKSLVNALPAEIFARVHRSTLVNLHKIKTIEPLSKGEFRLHLEHGHQIKVSRSHRQSILPLL